jgi:hypothetical protein
MSLDSVLAQVLAMVGPGEDDSTSLRKAREDLWNSSTPTSSLDDLFERAMVALEETEGALRRARMQQPGV